MEHIEIDTAAIAGTHASMVDQCGNLIFRAIANVDEMMRASKEFCSGEKMYAFMKKFGSDMHQFIANACEGLVIEMDNMSRAIDEQIKAINGYSTVPWREGSAIKSNYTWAVNEPLVLVEKNPEHFKFYKDEILAEFEEQMKGVDGNVQGFDENIDGLLAQITSEVLTPSLADSIRKKLKDVSNSLNEKFVEAYNLLKNNIDDLSTEITSQAKSANDNYVNDPSLRSSWAFHQ